MVFHMDDTMLRCILIKEITDVIFDIRIIPLAFNHVYVFVNGIINAVYMGRNL